MDPAVNGSHVDPQPDDPWTHIQNDIMEALARTRIPGEARQVLDVIFRKTYGWKKKIDAIALSQFCLATSLSKIAVCKALRKLESMNLVITEKGNAGINKYRINKHYDTWKPLPKKVTITKEGNLHYPKRKSSLPKMQPTNISVTNKAITNKKIYCPTSDEVRLAEKKELIKKVCTDPLFQKFYAAYPRKVAKEDAVKAWSNIQDITEELVDKMIQVIEHNLKTETWKKSEMNFIPYPATWLNGKRWNDEITSTAAESHSVIQDILDAQARAEEDRIHAR